MLYKLTIDESDKGKIEELRDKHYSDLTGTHELYDSLEFSGRCESYTKYRIHFVAYILEKNGIDTTFSIIE